MVLFVAALAQRLEVAQIIPPMRRVSTLHDVVHLLTSEPASVARWVPHKPVPPYALPVATAKACNMVSLKSLRVGNLWSRVEDWYSHVGTPPRIVADRPIGSSTTTGDGLIA
jgi:hypothetical protein